MSVYKFKYSVFYSIVYTLGFLMTTTLTVGMTLSAIKEGSFLVVDEGWSEFIFSISLNILLPSSLMLLGVISVKRLGFSFIKISFDSNQQKLIYERGSACKELNFDSIIETEDVPNKGVLLIKSEYDRITIPKEIERYSVLYALLKQHHLIDEKIDFDGFKTTLGLFYWFIGIGGLAFSLIPLSMLPDLIINYDGSSNSKTGLIILPILGFGMLLMLLLLANRYRFTKDALIKMNPLFTTQIPFSNIDKVHYNKEQRTLTINLIDDKLRWLRQLNGQSGIVIREPGNISIERLYSEIEYRKTACNN